MNYFSDEQFSEEEFQKMLNEAWDRDRMKQLDECIPVSQLTEEDIEKMEEEREKGLPNFWNGDL